MLPTLKGTSLLIDVGANTDSKPHNLVQFALMGKVYLENIHGITNPRIGLMNIGEEEVKGNELTKTTHNLLKKLDINFIGNVEGRDVYIGEADLIVTDGFTGNVTLKVSEGVVDVMLSMLKREIMSNIFSKVGFFFLQTLAQAHQKEARLRRIRRRPAAGGERHRHHRPRRLQRQGHQERHLPQLPSSSPQKVLDKISQEIEKMQGITHGAEICLNPRLNRHRHRRGPRHRQGHRPARWPRTGIVRRHFRHHAGRGSREDRRPRSKKPGVRALAVRTDVSSAATPRSWSSRPWATFGSVDILVNNAGITRDNLSHPHERKRLGPGPGHQPQGRRSSAPRPRPRR